MGEEWMTADAIFIFKKQKQWKQFTASAYIANAVLSFLISLKSGRHDAAFKTL